MKKIFLAILLLIIVIAVSYYQVHRQEAREQNRYEKGYEEGTRGVERLSGEVDSLRQVVDRQELEFSGKFEQTEQAYADTIDSLKEVVSLQEQKIMKLQSPDKKENSLTDKHALILSYYKKRYSELPGDLSNYEKRVALTEIREETAQKFAITVTELDKIRENNNLNY
ncbi:MAG: hypothetical protein PHU88_09495 [candidate division Zixibacteria bacterium]|nr:hypothetical protein [candidate division Zixibacteria bacterium]MDD5425370.1 hypothetical protein [candidate division Zixibacteria bacterium]